MKPKRQDPLARRNRANKNRGRAFENRCAEALSWTRVPYSGAQKGWGAGDVIDRFYERDGKWQAECKITIGQKTGLSIKGKWIKQMHRELNGRLPLMFFARKGSPRAWVLLTKEGMAQLGFVPDFYNNFTVLQDTDKGTFLIQQFTLDITHSQQHVYKLFVGRHPDEMKEYFIMSFDHFTRLAK